MINNRIRFSTASVLADVNGVPTLVKVRQLQSAMNTA